MVVRGTCTRRKTDRYILLQIYGRRKPRIESTALSADVIESAFISLGIVECLKRSA